MRVLAKLLAATIVLLSSLAILGCEKDREPKGPSAPNVTAIKAQPGEMALTIDLPGDLVGFYEAALHAKVTGYLKSISVDKGDHVKAGQVLAVIQVPELESNLEHAQANLVIQKLTYDRLRGVQKADPRLISKQDVDMAYAKYRQAQANVQTFRTMVGYTAIVAPFDGIITGRFADPGALIRAGGGDIGVDETSAQISPGATEGSGGHRSGGGPVLTIAKTDRLRVYVYVPGKWCRYIRNGTPATLTFDDVPELKLDAAVTRYAGALDLATRTMLAELDIDNHSGVLYPRMYAHVKLILVSHPHALRLPISAVNEEQGKAAVEVLESGRAVKRSVSVGITEPNYVEITSGLTADEPVLNPYNAELKNGEAVTLVTPAAAPGPVAAGH